MGFFEALHKALLQKLMTFFKFFGLYGSLAVPVITVPVFGGKTRLKL